MVCTTRLDLTAWGTHSPTAQEGKTEKVEEERLRLPLTTEETATLRQQLDSTYTPEMEGKIREAIHSIIEAPTLKAKRKKIDQAGAAVANTLGINRDAAMRSSNLPKKGPPQKTVHGLHLPKVLRKTRDKHLQERNRCRENIASWRRDIREREEKGGTESTEEFLNRTEEMREWERWEQAQKKDATREARKVIKEHEANRKQKSRMKTRNNYWKAIKYYHKDIYKEAVESGAAPTATIQAIETRQGELVVGQQKVAQAMGGHIAWSAPYKMRTREEGLAEEPPWLDRQYKDYLEAGNCARPDQTKINLHMDKKAYQQAVGGMKTNKAAGPMGIQNEILK